MKTILFDLDGTLLPMDQEVFTENYFKELAKKMAPFGYEPEMLIKSIWAGTREMVLNNGSKTNEKAFWDKFKEIYGDKTEKDIPVFEEFYENEFAKLKEYCGFNPLVKEITDGLKKAGYKIVLATNPIFPDIATRQRIKWAGLDADDFQLYTTYENSCYCKPNLKYYEAIAQEINIEPSECIMIGNDVKEDMVAKNLGMDVFLLTDCLINKENADISQYKKGNFRDLAAYLGI